MILLVVPAPRTPILTDSLISTSTITNTAAESTIYTTTLPVHALQPGTHFELDLQGIISSVASFNGIATFRFYINSTLLGTLTSTAANRTLIPCQISAHLTCRSSGPTGSIISFLSWEESADLKLASSGVVVLDTTAIHTRSITVQFATASVNNTISIEQASLLTTAL